MFHELVKELEMALPPDRITENVPLKELTSLRVGGAAPLVAEPQSVDEIKTLVKIFGNYGAGYLVLGKGTNVLVRDGGVDCPVIRIGKALSRVSVFENCITAESGASLSAVAAAACQNSLTGMEFASGIPGNVGGGVIMNAGAYGGELRDVVEAVSFVGPDGEEYTATNDEMEFGYRHSALSDSDCIVTAVGFSLRKGKKDEIAAKMSELNRRRREKQPLEYPSAGSTFKRPEGYYAGKLIEDAGLKGFSIGGAAVSEKHAGFVINKNNASADEILSVMEYVQRTVFDKSGVILQPEVKIWGKDK